ncbi:MAG TPA: Rieske 2Fe-2S domain-containing protein [Dehalococcoidia bacterium]|nr:Rieske 2Fe-2S domain-containing protein [Dehalococcoidia bacterium]
MLSREDNELLCRIGPGTPMGDLMRQYWIPALAVEELPAPDCPPVRVRLLGEDLIAYRATSGAVGLMQNACPHRGASMFFGRNEDEGLRCVYHGWKFDVTGACVEMPSEPAESNFKNKVQARAYPCRERGGVVWTYMGARPVEALPPLPVIEANMLPEGEYSVNVLMRDCNWVQALEGDLDTVHVAFLHGGHRRVEDATPGTFGYYGIKERAARFATIETEYGVTYGAYRTAEEDSHYWRIAHFLFPFWSMVPTGVLGVQKIARAWVPMDDEHTIFFHFSDPLSRSEGQRPMPEGTSEAERRRAANAALAATAMAEVLPNSTGWLGRYRNAANVSNDYKLDREMQRNRNYTGMPNITTEDQAVTESMGPIYTRTQEHLGVSDAMIIRMRRRLINAAKALRDQGVTPPGVDSPEVYRQRSGGVVLPRSVDWWQATTELRKAFVQHQRPQSALP